MISENEVKVLSLIEEHQSGIIDFLQQLIRYRTITPPDNGRAESNDYRDLQNFVANALQGIGCSLEMWDADASELDIFPGCGVKPDRDLSNMPVLAGKLPGSGGGNSLILNGHYDVVPVGLLANWHYDPFEGQVADGRLYGRGACDMKSGIAAMIQALRFIQQSGIELKGDLIIQTVPDEEASCMGTLSCCQRGYTADAAIIPEPTNMQLFVALRGSLYGKITVYGRAGHAEMSQPHWSEGGAVNAITKAAKVIEALEDLNDQWRTQREKQHRYLDPDIITPTVIHGGDWSVTYPEKVEITFGSNFIPSTHNKREEIEAQLGRVAALDPWMRANPPKLDADGEWWYGAEASENEAIVQLGKEVLSELGITPTLGGFGTLTDAIHLINYSKIPTISFGPSIRTAHMADEFVTIAELVKTTQALALLILRWCG
ncbi:MAG TPA: ArgE/DapE family deacylase [Anaerolineales bacterium]|jgi:acetylornithine deacetylase|nr:ArgE/DapE family deacylase [Anaerolineales bacterium]